jgi:hypothetical protein
MQPMRPRYFVPKGLQHLCPTIHTEVIPTILTPSTIHRIHDPVSATPAPPAPSSSSTLSTSSKDVDPERVFESKGTSSTSVPRASSHPHSSSEPAARCTYATSDGRRCRMFIGKEHPELCHHHAVLELRALEKSVAQPIAREILGALTDLRSGAGINQAMANLFVLSADGRVSERRAASLTYLSQLLLQSLGAIRNDWRGTPAPSAKQGLRAKLAPALPSPEPDAPPAEPND